MKVGKIFSVSFSPTGGSGKVARTVAEALGGSEIRTLDLTLRETPDVALSDTDFLVVSMPVYSGRMPALAKERFAAVRGNKTPCVAVVVYGNRHYDDALDELVTCCEEQGFTVVGAAAFIAEHSFSFPDSPVAEGRPDAQDLVRATEFAQAVVQGRTDPQSLPRKSAYKTLPGQPFPAATGVDESRCTKCGKCAAVCPTGCIEMERDCFPVTQPHNCLWCLACQRVCAVDARVLLQEKISQSNQKLQTHFSHRREPEWW